MRELCLSSAIDGIVFRQFPFVCRGLYESNLSFVTKSKISNMFDFLSFVTLCLLCVATKVFFLTMEQYVWLDKESFDNILMSIVPYPQKEEI